MDKWREKNFFLHIRFGLGVCIVDAKNRIFAIFSALAISKNVVISDISGQTLDKLFFFRYNKMSREVRELAKKIRDLDVKDPFRARAMSQLLDRLYNLGLIPTKRGLDLCDKITASSFCRSDHHSSIWVWNQRVM